MTRRGYTLYQQLVKNGADKDGQELLFVYMQGKKPESPNQAMAIFLTLNGKYIDPEIEDGRITSIRTISAPPPNITSEDIIGNFSTMSVVNSWNIIDESYLIGEECFEE